MKKWLEIKNKNGDIVGWEGNPEYRKRHIEMCTLLMDTAITGNKEKAYEIMREEAAEEKRILREEVQRGLKKNIGE